MSAEMQTCKKTWNKSRKKDTTTRHAERMSQLFAEKNIARDKIQWNEYSIIGDEK